MKIAILGTGCAKCDALESATKKAADALEIDYSMEHVTEIKRFASFGVMITPALVVDGQVLAAGQVPNEEQLSAMLRKAAESQER